MIIPKRNAMSLYLLRVRMTTVSCDHILHFGGWTQTSPIRRSVSPLPPPPHAHSILFCVTYVDSWAPRYLGVRYRK